MTRLGAVDGDIIFFGADKRSVVNEALGALRLRVAEDLGLVQAGLGTTVGGRFSDV